MKKLIFFVALALFAVIFLFGLFNSNSIDYSRRTVKSNKVQRRTVKSNKVQFSMFTQYLYSLKKSHKFPPVPTVVPPHIPSIPNNLAGIEAQCVQLCQASFGYQAWQLCNNACTNPTSLCDFALCSAQALHTKNFNQFKDCCKEHHH